MPDVPHTAVPRARLWLLALGAGFVAATVLYDSRIGINVLLWTTLAAVALLATRPAGDPMRRVVATPVAFALLLAGGAGVTADGPTQAFLVLMTACLLALGTVLMALAPAAERYGAPLILTAPIVAFANAAKRGVFALVDGIGSIGAVRRSPALRGAIVGVPIALVFAVLFADADPLFARGRDAVSSLLTTVQLPGRIVFFAIVSIGVLGALVFAASDDARVSAARSRAPRVFLGDGAERTIVLACAAAVSWLFVILQIAYVAIDAPARAGSGVTYAQYAHRGFGQLSVVATIAVLLVMEALSRARPDAGPPRLRTAAYALLAAVAGVLVSAFHRVTLYENVYGFTTARVEAQAYMLVVLAVLALCAIETARGFDSARLARGTMIAALVAITTLAYWNDQAWVVRQDVARFAGTKRLDVEYLARLAPDAYPALLEALPRLPDAQRQQLASALWPEAMCAVRRDDHWFEWNASRARARDAFTSRGFAITPFPDRSCSVD